MCILRARPPLAELPPHPSSTGRHSQSGGRGDRVLAQGEARAGAGDDGCFCRTNFHLPRVALKEALVNLALLRRTVRGPGTLSTMSSTALAIANAVQLSV